MKFVEYIAVKNDLEKNGSNVNEFVEEITGKSLNELYEAEKDKIETSRAGKGFHSPKFVLKRKKLNNLANQFLKSAKEKVIAKYAPKILESSKNLITKAATLNKEGKSLEEINQLLSKEARNAISVQDKSMGRLDQIIEKMQSGFDKRVQKIISTDSGLSEKSQNQLDMYWSLLSLQVRQALDKALVKYREDMIEKAVENNEEMEKMLKRMTASPNYKEKIENYEKEIKSKKEEFKNAGEGEEKKEFKAGQVYQYTSSEGDTYNAEVIEVLDNGDLKLKSKKNPKGWVVKKENIDKKIGKMIKGTEEKEEKKLEPTEA